MLAFRTLFSRRSSRAAWAGRLEDPHRQGHHLPGGADDFELVIDAERGILLRLESRIDGFPFVVIELLEVHFDVAFDDEVFVFRAPAGEAIRSHRDMFVPPQAMSLEEAVRRAPFTVLAPRLLPDGWRVEVLFTPGQEWPRTPPGVVMHLHDPTRLHQVRILQSAETFDDALEWTPVEVEGRPLLVYQHTGVLDEDIDVKFERSGTHAHLIGNLDRATMLQIAGSLAPTPPNLPPLVER